MTGTRGSIISHRHVPPAARQRHLEELEDVAVIVYDQDLQSSEDAGRSPRTRRRGIETLDVAWRLLASPLSDLGLPVPLSVGLPPPEDRAFADVWSALGGELKPSLDVVITAPTDTGQRRETGPPVVLPPKTVIGGQDGWPAQETRTGRPTGSP